jgi:hypothetical protein
MEWPKESGYQSRLLARLSEKDRKILLDRSASFGRSRLDYGSSMVFSAANIAPSGQSGQPVPPIQPKTLINVVTVIFRTKEKLTRNSFVHTKPENLRRALHLGLIEAEAKGVRSIVIPSSISKNYFAGGKNDECIITSIKEWITNNPNSNIHTIVIAQKDPTPKVARKKRFGSLHRRASGGGGGGGGSGGLPIPDFRL